MIKLITEKSQLRVGQTTRPYYLNGAVASEHLFTVNQWEIDNFPPKHLFIEHISYPDRRQLTWEYAKSKVDEWPFRIYPSELLDDNEYYFKCGNKNQCYVNYSDYLLDWKSELVEYPIYIDPPFPVIPEVPEPWLAKQEPESDPWVDCPADPKRVKMPCEAKFDGIHPGNTNLYNNNILKNIGSGYPDYPFICQNNALYSKCQVRQSSIIPDDVVKRLWVVEFISGRICQPDDYMTKNELRSKFIDMVRYAPLAELPPESEWRVA